MSANVTCVEALFQNSMYNSIAIPQPVACQSHCNGTPAWSAAVEPTLGMGDN